jgi:excisionase family DNA binding protein
MEEAARLLGVSIDRLTEMRANNEIFGYRDGTNWKFKISELERVADEMGVPLGGGGSAVEDSSDDGGGFKVSDSAQDMLLDDLSEASDFSGLDFGDELDSSSGGSRKLRADDQYTESESVEMMEDSSAEVFKTGSPSDIHDEPESVELELADSGRLADKSGGKDKFRTQGEIVPSDSNVTDDDEELSFGNSSIRLASGSSRKLVGDDSVLDEPVERRKSPSDTGKMLGDGNDDLFSDDISLADSSSGADSLELSSDFTDSGDMVLEDSDSSTEVRLEESGINLSANDSGILLENNSGVGSDIYSLELPEDDDDLIVVEGSSDDEFNLTPLADPLEEEESTGSQVIALEDSEIYADESADSIGDDEFIAQPAMLDDDFGGSLDDGFGMGLMPAGMTQTVVPEAPYNIWQISALSIVTLLLMIGGMVAYGACQNMWMPDDQVSQRTVLNFFLNLIGVK